MTSSDGHKELTTMERAAYALKHLRAQLDKYREPIAIVGMACRFPGGANDLDSYWQLMRDGREAVVKVPKDRWDATSSTARIPTRISSGRPTRATGASSTSASTASTRTSSRSRRGKRW